MIVKDKLVRSPLEEIATESKVTITLDKLFERATRELKTDMKDTNAKTPMQTMVNNYNTLLHVLV